MYFSSFLKRQEFPREGLTNEAYKVYFRAKKRKIFNAAKINSCYQPHSKIVLEFQSSKLRFSPAAAVVQLKGSSIAKLETSFRIQWHLALPFLFFI